MEITKHLRKDKLTKNGLAPIRIFVSFEGRRVYFSTGEKVDPAPKFWDAAGQKVTGKYSYHLSINAVLDKFQNAIRDVYQQMKLAGVIYSEAEFKEKVIALVKPAAPAALPVVATPQKDKSRFWTLFDEWVKEQSNKISKVRKRKVGPKVRQHLNNTRNRLQKFEKEWNYPITFEGMDNKFYTAFVEYTIDTLDQSVNTLAKHMQRLKSFLEWCEDNDVVVNRKYRKFESTQFYVGVDALTEQELQTIYKLKIEDTPQVRELIRRQFIKDNYDELPDPEPLLLKRIAELERMKDVFLFCCYTGLRISDVFKLRPEHITGELIVIAATKTENVCYIPFYDDDIFRPVEIVEKYQDQIPNYFPPNVFVNDYLAVVQKLIGLERINLKTKIGRKTYATLKVYQGVPTRFIMQATGHKSESSFNRYVGIDTQKLLAGFKDKSTGIAPKRGNV